MVVGKGVEGGEGGRRLTENCGIKINSWRMHAKATSNQVRTRSFVLSQKLTWRHREVCCCPVHRDTKGGKEIDRRPRSVKGLTTSIVYGNNFNLITVV